MKNSLSLLLGAGAILLTPTISYTQSIPCYQGMAKADLDINNVRTTILNGGDMWWNLNDARYEIPKGSQKHSVFAGAIWLGGIDANGQLAVAAQTYRQTGNDFWPGPLDTTNATTTKDVCKAYDKVYKISRGEIEEFKVRRGTPGYVTPAVILNWPAHGNQAIGQAKILAPFTDVNGDGIYNSADGDYPAFAENGSDCKNKLLGDQAIWWVFNDKGNVHSETGGAAFGIEIHAQAFAYRTHDEINDATFYQYKAINRSASTYNNMHWGQWIDIDLGLFMDDYVGCDVGRGLGFGYNGTAKDGTGGVGTYGEAPPAMGVDFLGGPLADPNDGIDNDRDGTVDEGGERIMMSKFMYYNNDMSTNGNPQSAQDFYNYLKGIWRDGTRMTYGGDGHLSSSDPADFMFPGDTDPTGPTWSETSAGNVPADRRFMMSAGPFTFQPGAVQTITVGLPWARDTSALASVEKLRLVDDKVQQLFDNCFQLPCIAPFQDFTYNVKDRNVNLQYNFAATTFSWTFGDGTTSTQRFPAHTYAKDGYYEVCLTVTNSCGTASTCKTIRVDYNGDELGVKLVRIEGQGNGGQYIDFTDEMVTAILSSPDHQILNPTYKHKAGPVDVTVVDPLALPASWFTIQFSGVDNNSGWKIFKQGSTDTVHSINTISMENEQLIPQWGISIKLKQSGYPGTSTTPNNGFISASKLFKDPSKAWLTGLMDVDFDASGKNWIRSGTVVATGTPAILPPGGVDYVGQDDNEVYEKVLGGTWAPYRLSSFSKDGPAWQQTFLNATKMQDLASVDVVFTSDKSKWTRCPVVETQDDPTLAIGNAKKLSIRKSPSVDKNGSPDGTGTGMGWFPGYAINIETGERLNIIFGEDSWLSGENGADMIWNPTDKVETSLGAPLFGGKHFIYVMGHNADTYYDAADPVLGNELSSTPKYDEGKAIYKQLAAFDATNNAKYKSNVFKDAMWVTIPMPAPGKTLLATDATVKLRVAKPYATYNTSATPLNNNFPLYQFNGADVALDVKRAELAKSNCIVYPNPFSDKAMISFTKEGHQPVTLVIYDLTGKVVLRREGISEKYILLEKEKLNNGLYMFQINERGGKLLHTGKFIIQ